MRIEKGLAVSRGIAIGRIWRYEQPVVTFKEYCIDNVEKEIARFNECRETVGQELLEIQNNLTARAGADCGEIMAIQREFLSDPDFGEAIAALIKEKKINAESAVEQIQNSLSEEFSAIPDEYFSQRASDIKDLGNRMIQNLLGVKPGRMVEDEECEPAVIFAEDLTPSDTAQIDLDKTLAICVEGGSQTSHSAILSRSLGIPALVGLGAVDITPGETVIVDALEGRLIIEPDPEQIQEYEAKRKQFIVSQTELLRKAFGPAVTADGRKILVESNIADQADARNAKEHGAEGVGLLRTEFLFLDRSTLPDEEEQYKTYDAIASIFSGFHTTIRTLDIGGDKPLPALPAVSEQNPFLGNRAIRLALSEPEKLFIPQIKALLRAGDKRNIRILLPMVGSIDEIMTIRQYIDEACTRLKSEGTACPARPAVGIMVEIPSAAIMTGVFAEYVDFFSIGTNDLTQYTLAVDRTNQNVAHLADYFHPAVVKLISSVVEGARPFGRPVGMCGEMAGDLLAVPLLVGLGLDELSMAASEIPGVKDIVRRLNLSECQKLAESALTAKTASELRQLCLNFSRENILTQAG